MVDQVKIILTTQDDTKPGFESLQRNADKSRSALDSLYASAERIGRGGGSFDAQVESAKRYYESVDRINRELSNMRPDQSGSALAQIHADAQKLDAASQQVGQLNSSLDAARKQAEETAKAFSRITIGPAQLELSDGVIKGVTDKLEKIDLTSWQAKIAYGAGAGIGAGIETAKTAMEKLEEWAKTKAIVAGVAIAAGISIAALSAVYTAYKVVEQSIGFIYGLFSGDSYKSANIDALVALNAEVLKLQTGLGISAKDAGALNQALKLKGVDQSAYVSTFEKATVAIHNNTDELDRLGVKYKDQQGNLLPLNDTLASASAVLATYTEGWDRQHAAAAIGMGSEKEIQQALSITQESIDQARQRLVDYGLVIGPGTQAAVERYKTAMREFDTEAELTSQGFKKAISDQIMPALTDLSEFFRDGFPFIVNVTRYSMASITSLFYGLKTSIYAVLESVAGTLSAFGSVVVSVGSASAKVLSGDISGAKNDLVKGWQDARDRLADIGSNIVAQSDRNAKAMRLAWGAENLDPTGKADPAKGKTWDDGKAARAALEASANWKKLYASQAEQKAAAIKDLDAAYSKETATIGNNQQKQLALAAEYYAKRSELVKKFEPKQEANPYADLLKTISEKLAIQQQEIDGTVKLTESEKYRVKVQQEMADGTLKLNAAQRQSVNAKLDLLVANEKGIAQEAAIQKAIAERYQEGIRVLDQINQQIVAQQEHNSMIGLTPGAIEAVKAARLDAEIVEKKALLNMFDENGLRGAQIDIIRDQVAALEKLKQAHLEGAIKQDGVDAAKKTMETWQKGWEETDRIARTAFSSWLDSGSNFAEQTGKMLKSALMSAIYEATFRPVIFQAYASVTGALGAGGGSAPNSPGGMNAGSLLSTGSNLHSMFTGGSAAAWTSSATSFGTSAVGQSLGLSAQTSYIANAELATEAVAANTVALTETGSALASFAGSIGAAMPYIAAALAIYSMFSGPGGGPKDTGGATIDLTASGFTKAYDPNPNAGMDKTLEALSGDIHNYASLLGGTTGGLRASLSYQSDPNGDASSSIYSRVEDATGKQVYSVVGKDVGRDQNTMNTEMQLEAKHVLLAALQNSDMPREVAAVLATVDAASATSAQVDRVLALAQTFKTIGQILPDIAGMSDTNLATLAKGVSENFSAEVSSFYTTFYSQTERDIATKASAQKQIDDTFAKLGYAVPKTSEELKAFIVGLDRTDEAGIAATETLMKLGPAFDTIQKLAENLLSNAVAAYIGYQNMVGNTGAGLAASSAVAARSDAATQGKLAAAFGMDRGALDFAVAQAGGNLADIAAKYWADMNDTQRAAVTEALASRTAYIGAVKAQFDEQLKLAQTHYANVKKLADFSAGIDANIASINIAAGLLTSADYNAQQTAKVKASLAALGPDAGIDDKLSLATQLRDLTMERWQVELDSLTKAKEFAGSVRDYLNNLKVSDNSPLDLQAKLSEAAQQYADTLKAANSDDAAAKSALTGKADTWLALSKQWGMGEWSNVYQQVQDGLGPLADTLSIDQQLLTTQKTTAQRAADTVAQLQAIKGQSAGWQATEQGLLASAVAGLEPLTHMLDSLGAGGAIVASINALPAALAALIGNGQIVNTPKSVFASLGAGAAETKAFNSLTPPASTSARTSLLAADVAVESFIGGGDPVAAMKAALAGGASLADVTGSLNQHLGGGYTEEGLAAWAQAAGVKAFASGGDHLGGLRLVGENGPELEVTGPSRIFNAEQTRSLLSSPPGNNNAELLAELRALRAEVARLREESADGKNAELQQRGAAAAEQINRLGRIVRATEDSARIKSLEGALS